jgi:hypothetical protein
MGTRFTATDMVNGVIRVLAERGYSSFLVRTDRLDAAFAEAFADLLDLAPEYGLDVRFQIARDDFGESQVLRSALNAAGQRDVVSFDNPEYQDMRVDRQKVASTVRFEGLPGDRELYERLADSFITAYEKLATEDDLIRLPAT